MDRAAGGQPRILSHLGMAGAAFHGRLRSHRLAGHTSDLLQVSTDEAPGCGEKTGETLPDPDTHRAARYPSLCQDRQAHPAGTCGPADRRRGRCAAGHFHPRCLLLHLLFDRLYRRRLLGEDPCRAELFPPAALRQLFSEDPAGTDLPAELSWSAAAGGAQIQLFRLLQRAAADGVGILQKAGDRRPPGADDESGLREHRGRVRLTSAGGSDVRGRTALL